jgi:repressor LexA
MRSEFSEVQKRILQCIYDFMQQNDMPPTNREIGKDVGINSTGHVDYHLGQMEKKQLIERDSRRSRGIRLLPKAYELLGIDPDAADVRTSAAPVPLRLPIYGPIAAGVPLQIDTSHEEALDLSAIFARDDIFALRVRGKSMIGDLIDDGDYVIVQASDTAVNGECVVATVSGPGTEREATLKRIYWEGKLARLQPSNPEMQPIYVDAKDVMVQGRVISVIRTV